MYCAGYRKIPTVSAAIKFAEISHYNNGSNDGTKWQDKHYVTFISTSNCLWAISDDHSFNRELSKKLSNNSAVHRSSCLNRRGRLVRPSGVYWQSSNPSRSFGTSLISLNLSLYMEGNTHSVVICEGVGSKQHTPLTLQFQGNHVRTNECVQHGQKVAGPGWDSTRTGGQSRD